MKAIEFNSRVENGAISIPAELGLVDGRVIRVLILTNEPDGDLTADAKDTAFWAKTAGSSQDQTNVLNTTAGSWAGELIREPQGEYPELTRILSLLSNSNSTKSAAACGTFNFSEQGGKVRAEYGKALLSSLSRDLTRLLGKGFQPQQPRPHAAALHRIAK